MSPIKILLIVLVTFFISPIESIRIKSFDFLDSYRSWESEIWKGLKRNGGEKFEKVRNVLLSPYLMPFTNDSDISSMEHVCVQSLREFSIKIGERFALMMFLVKTQRKDMGYLVNVAQKENYCEKMKVIVNSIESCIQELPESQSLTLGQSQYSQVLEIYTIISEIFLRVYIMTDVVLINRALEVTDYSIFYENERLKNELKELEPSIDKKFEKLLRKQNNEVIREQPLKGWEGITYAELTQILQGCFVEKSNFIELWPIPFKNYNILKCEHFKPEFTVCPADDGKRRYIRENTNICKNKQEPLDINDNSLFCYCDYRGPSNRYFSLQEVTANITDNRVITGLRMVLTDHVFYWQIRTAKLDKYGTTIPNTGEYIPINTFSPLDPSKIEGNDYFVVTSENRRFNFLTVNVTYPYVLTGIKFSAMYNELTVQGRFHEMDAASGIILEHGRKEYTWIHNVNWRSKCIEAGDITPKISNSCVEFSPSRKEDDLAQIIEPHLDTQFVVTKPDRPLAGFEIYYQHFTDFHAFNDSISILSVKLYDFKIPV